MDRSRSPRVLQQLTVGDTLTMPNGGVGVVTQIQGDQVTAGPFQWPEGQRPVTRDVFFNGSVSAAMAMQTPQQPPQAQVSAAEAAQVMEDMRIIGQSVGNRPPVSSARR